MRRRKRSKLGEHHPVGSGNRTTFATSKVPDNRLHKDDQVFVEDTSLFSGAVCVRPKGERDCYWTFLEAVN
jgi:hypothetical protein